MSHPVKPYWVTESPSRGFYSVHESPNRIRPIMSARAELLRTVVVVDSDPVTTTTKNGCSAAFEVELIRAVIPRAAEDYDPAIHDRHRDRLAVLVSEARRVAEDTGRDVNPSQADRLRDFIEGATWVTDEWGHVGAAVQFFRTLAETEDLSQPWEAPPAREPDSDREIAVWDGPDHDPEARATWQTALGHLKERVTRPNFETWLTHSVGLAQGDGYFVVGVPNAFVAEMLEQRMYSLIARTLERVVKQDLEVRFNVRLNM